MALDPEIALAAAPQPGTIPLDVGGSILKGLQIQNARLQPALTEQQIAASQQSVAASKASQALTEAQTPGAVAQSQQQQTEAAKQARALAAKQWWGSHATDFLETNSNNPNGPQTINYPKAMSAARAMGYADLIPELAKSWEDTRTVSIANATSQQDLNEKLSKGTVEAKNIVAQYVDPKASPAVQFQQYSAARNQILKNNPAFVTEDTLPARPKNLAEWVSSTRAASVPETTKRANELTEKSQAQTQQQIELQKKQQQMSAGEHIVAANDATGAADRYQGAITVLQAMKPGEHPTGDQATALNAILAQYNQQYGTSLNSQTSSNKAMLDALTKERNRLQHQAQAHSNIAITGGALPKEAAPVSLPEGPASGAPGTLGAPAPLTEAGTATLQPSLGKFEQYRRK